MSKLSQVKALRDQVPGLSLEAALAHVNSGTADEAAALFREGQRDRLSRRDYLAGMAMQGILAGKPKGYQGSVAVDAVKAADALIAELDGET